MIDDRSVRLIACAAGTALAVGYLAGATSHRIARIYKSTIRVQQDHEKIIETLAEMRIDHSYFRHAADTLMGAQDDQRAAMERALQATVPEGTVSELRRRSGGTG